jgi:hypothetical protein
MGSSDIDTTADIRQYCKELHDAVAALPFATAVPAQDDDPEICSDDSDDEPINLELAIAQHSYCCLISYKHK